MSFRINTNTAAMTAFRSLSQTGDNLTQSMTRLSTGLRINSGADDPAGLIAVTGYQTQIGGIEAAMRNNQDAVNFGKTADGALGEINSLLQSARSLAVANGSSSLDATQKQANQNQLNNILSSIDRISQTTSFGSRKLLDGSAGTHGSVADYTKVKNAYISGTLGGTQMTTDGSLDVNVTTAAAQGSVTGTVAYSAATVTVASAGTFTINGYAFNVDKGVTIQSVVDQINAASGNTGVSAAYSATHVVLSTIGYGSDQKVTLTEGAAAIINAVNTTATDTGTDAAADVTYKDGTGSTVSTASFTSGKGLTLKDAEGNSIDLTTLGGNTTGNRAGAVQILAGNSQFQIGANAGNTANLNLASFSTNSLSLTGSNIDITGSDMTAALNSIDAALSQVSTARGNIGSFMTNTISSNMRALSVAKDNLSATMSQIQDVDVASEMTNYTKLQILQQSGLAMLAQANSAPQAVLKLLG